MPHEPWRHIKAFQNYYPPVPNRSSLFHLCKVIVYHDWVEYLGGSRVLHLCVGSMKIVSNVRGILCEIVWGNYGFAFVCEVGKSCMHCNVVLGTCFYLWERSLRVVSSVRATLSTKLQSLISSPVIFTFFTLLILISCNHSFIRSSIILILTLWLVFFLSQLFL